MGKGRLSGRTSALRADAIRARAGSTLAQCALFLIFLEGPTPGWHPRVRSSGSRLALNLEVLGRGLAAIGNLFVFDRLSFVERGKASFLDRRNMNENVLAATRRLDESKTLGRVEPLHSAFSHHVVSAGSKTKIGPPVPANRHVRRAH